MGYVPSDDGQHSPWIIESLKPIQISKVDLEEYIRLRKEFTKEEWVDLLVQSMGLEPEHFNFRSKLLQIARLIPFCENNYNFIELGPKGTGKSHIFSELSPHGILVSGGDVSQAKLFVNNANNRIGLVGFWDVVTFDEFAGSTKTPDKKLIDIMKNYMANKSFSRGKDVLGATASFAFVGNTEHSVPYMMKNTNLFDALPKVYYDSAFLDRLHIYIPGWEISKLRNEMFTENYGFIVDYLAEILKELRKEDYSSLIKNYVELDNSMTARDREGILKTFSGMVKILYPDGVLSHSDAIEIIEFSAEGRKRVKDQLIKMDDTFETVKFVFINKEMNKAQKIETLENVQYRPASESYIGDDEDPEIKSKKVQIESEIVPKPGQIIIQDNQEGITFEKLFSPYMKGAQNIILTDPYIRYPHQFKLLLEFCTVLTEIKDSDQETSLKVISWNEPEDRLKESTENFEEVAQSVFDLGINLTYELNPNIHDRTITADNGWKIILGRGLDIYIKPEGRFHIADVYPEKRKCRACEITYIKL